MSDIGVNSVIPVCDGCGRRAKYECAVGVEGLTLILCRAPVCGGADDEVGRWCSGHRHRHGTMGYVAQGKVRADFKQFADQTSFWTQLVSWYRNSFWSQQRKALQVWEEMQRAFPPPAPMPELTLVFENGATYLSAGPGQMKLKEQT